MKTYRLLPVQDDGCAASTCAEIGADSDGDALRQVYDSPEDRAVEIWEGRRYVCTLTRDPVTKHPDWIIVASPGRALAR